MIIKLWQRDKLHNHWLHACCADDKEEVLRFTLTQYCIARAALFPCAVSLIFGATSMVD